MCRLSHSLPGSPLTQLVLHQHHNMKQNKLEPFLATSQVKHQLQLGLQCLYSQTIVLVSTVTASHLSLTVS